MKKIVELKKEKRFKIPKGYEIGSIIVEKKDGTRDVFKKVNRDIKRDEDLIKLIETKLKGGFNDSG